MHKGRDVPRQSQSQCLGGVAGLGIFCPLPGGQDVPLHLLLPLPRKVWKRKARAEGARVGDMQLACSGASFTPPPAPLCLLEV